MVADLVLATGLAPSEIINADPLDIRALYERLRRQNREARKHGGNLRFPNRPR